MCRDLNGLCNQGFFLWDVLGRAGFGFGFRFGFGFGFVLGLGLSFLFGLGFLLF